ncbi:MAG TPA: Rossmann-like fold-containing protein, partial [Candidatus Babeliaceae bacterium]|nr:Rossmann-like fold-containing protein [Candidatus Babeliaceae bacterium]
MASVLNPVQGPSSSIACSRKHKSRLILGEGNFTYVEALLKKHKAKHPNLGEAITATEYDLGCLERNKERIEALRKEGVYIPDVPVDATQISYQFSQRRFERIHWNCPFLGTTTEERSRLRNQVLPRFFQSASEMQEPGDRIHVALAQEKDLSSGRSFPYRYERQGEYGIVRA